MMGHMHSYTIRPLELGDTAALLAFANALIVEDTYLLLLSGNPMTLAEESAYVKNSLKQMGLSEKIHIVAENKGHIIGSATIIRGVKRKNHIGEVGITVAKEYRRQGIGKLLMTELLKRAKDMGLRMVYLHCFENNAPAIVMYQKFGFIQCGKLPDAFLWRGQFVAELTLYKTVS